MSVVAVSRSSRLAASAPIVWAHATAMADINRELAPWMRMTFPPAAAGLSLADADADVRLGEPLFTSWILFLGFLPVDRMRLVLTELDPGRRFVERSAMTVLRSWRHERTVEPDGDGCVVTDSVEAAPPLGFGAPILRWVLGRFFAHRHRRLLRTFGAHPTGRTESADRITTTSALPGRT